MAFDPKPQPGQKGQDHMTAEKPKDARTLQAPAVSTPLTLDDLPPASTTRWVTRRKALVVKAVRIGLISLDEACRRYKLSVEEFLSWQRLLDSHGLKGLRSTRTKDYRGAALAH